jgi:hypothetical protein
MSAATAPATSCASMTEDGWEYLHFHRNISPTANPDLDPHDNLAEYIAGSDPNSSNSYFQITNAWQDVSGYVVEWAPCVTGRWYGVNWTNDLAGGFTSIVDNIDFLQNSFTDTIHTTEDAGFYQMEVQLK